MKEKQVAGANLSFLRLINEGVQGRLGTDFGIWYKLYYIIND
jgi:hypothetical protein